MIHLMSIFFSFFIHADLPTVPPFPTYEPEVNALMALFNQDKLAPSYIRAKFNELSNKKRKEMNDYENAYRRRTEGEQTLATNEYDSAEKDAIKKWRVENPKGDFRAFHKDIQDKRKAFKDLQAATRRSFSEEMKNKRKAFDEFMKIRRDEFDKKYDEYSDAYRKKPVEIPPEVKEFKEIPKGPGIPLSPSTQ
jgi:hypothetical protein